MQVSWKKTWISLQQFVIKLYNSDYGQLSQETWTFLHDIYDGSPVLFYEGEKDNEKENQKLQDEEEDIQ